MRAAFWAACCWGARLYMLLLEADEPARDRRVPGPQPRAAAGTVAVYSVIFALILARNLWRMYRSKAVGMLQGQECGGKGTPHPLGRGPFGHFDPGRRLWPGPCQRQHHLGALCVLFAVLLVIIGTYCLFTSGSIALLKGLRRNKITTTIPPLHRCVRHDVANGRTPWGLPASAFCRRRCW